jgi:hypothetical protein
MLFLRVNVIPVNPEIHANVMHPLSVLNIIFEPWFVYVPYIVVFLKFLLDMHSLIKYVDIVNAELIESTLKQTIMCSCFNDFLWISKKKMLRASNMYCSLHLINVHIKKNTDSNSSLQR